LGVWSYRESVRGEEGNWMRRKKGKGIEKEEGDWWRQEEWEGAEEERWEYDQRRRRGWKEECEV